MSANRTTLGGVLHAREAIQLFPTMRTVAGTSVGKGETKDWGNGMVSNWRDYTGELTAEQIANLEEWERDPSRPDSRLRAARAMAESNALQLLHGDVPEPPDAVEVGEWIQYGGAELARRDFSSGYLRQDGDLSVGMSGFQLSDGSVHREITVDAGVGLTAAQARALGLMLIDVADEIDQGRVWAQGPGAIPWAEFAGDDDEGERKFEFHFVPAAADALAEAYIDMIAECTPGVVDDLLKADRTVKGWQGWAYLVIRKRLLSSYREKVNQILPQRVSLPVARAAYATVEHAAGKAVRSLVLSLVSEADGGGLKGGLLGADLSGREDLIALAMWHTERSVPDLRGRIAGR